MYWHPAHFGAYTNMLGAFAHFLARSPDRDAVIVFQHLAAERCTDILSGETLPAENGRIRVRVPAGIFRVIDITHP